MRFNIPWCGPRLALLSLFVFLLLASYLPRLQSEFPQQDALEDLHGRRTLSVAEELKEGISSPPSSSSSSSSRPPPARYSPPLSPRPFKDKYNKAPPVKIIEEANAEYQNGVYVCRPDYMNVVLAPTQAQLNQIQRTWIATMMLGYSAAATSPINVLVWGLGHDSQIWYSVHCSNIQKFGGKIHFLEDNFEWVAKITGDYPQLEGNAFYFPKENFQTDLSEAMDFLQNPRDTLKLPERIEGECWDIVLLDAPPGYGENSGRHEATYWSVQMAKRCLKQGHQRDIIIFLHDVQRLVEDAIFNKLLKTAGLELGKVLGEFGHLKAVKISAVV